MSSQPTNLTWAIHGPSALIQKPVPVPIPGPHQALVRITAAALNYRDILVTSHSPAYNLVHKPDLVPCSDGAGIVEAAGSDSAWTPGQRVTVHPTTWKDGDARNYVHEEVLGAGICDGTLQRYMVVEDGLLRRSAANLDDGEVASLWTAGLTAWHALFEGPWGTVGEGSTVLTQGTGGVSTMAIQLASAVGATVIATSSSDEKLEVARALGATHLINYRKTPEWADEVLRLTGGKGVDIVVEVGGAETIEQSLKSTRQAGVVAVIGILSKSKKADLIPPILYGPKTVWGILGAGSVEMARRMTDFVEKHDIHPVIAKRFSFDEAKEALAALESQKEIGKIVVEV